jgi:hypothetical protein
MKLPLCPEVCQSCQEGKHAFHVLTELGDLVALPGEPGHPMSIVGYAENEDEFITLIDAAYRAIYGDCT